MSTGSPDAHAPSSTTGTGASPSWRRHLGTVGWILCSLLIVAIVVGAWMRLRDERTSVDLAARIATGDRPPAPAIPRTELTGDGTPGLPTWYRQRDGRQVASGDGRVIIVNFWASWCGPCEDEAPELRDLAREYDDRVLVVGVDQEDLESDARAFVRRHELGFPIVRGSRDDKDAWGVAGYPETFVIGTDARIGAHVNGPIDVESLRAAVDAELERGETGRT